MEATYGIVLRTERIAPRMVRIVLGGDGLASFTPSPYTDQYISALFVPDGAPYSVPFDVETARGVADGLAPRQRRETVRRWDGDRRELTVDIVTHGDEGYAGRWANHAVPGDHLQFVGPGGAYSPDATADWHLMVGDESALPAVGASLEALDPGARAVAVIVVDGADHHVDVPTRADLDLVWVHRDESVGDPDALLHAVHDLTFPAGRVHAFVHGEAGEVRSVRKHLLGERGLPKQGQSISPYWRRQHSDEQWRAIKSQWLAEADLDV
jgi:NADPH-dependent ferric siderophore reductase